MKLIIVGWSGRWARLLRLDETAEILRGETF